LSAQIRGKRARNPRGVRGLLPYPGIGGRIVGSRMREPGDRSLRLCRKEPAMTEATIAGANKPAWVDLATDDTAASRYFYSKLFGWQVEVNPDPQYCGYALAKT